MELADLSHQAGEWLRGVGPMTEVVISSRVRLARNLAGRSFLTRCNSDEILQLEQVLRDVILKCKVTPKLSYINIAEASGLDRQLLVERHLISRQLAQAEHARGVAISDDETVAIMVNEEDHLRMQVLQSGLGLVESVEKILQIDDILEEHLDFAFHSQFGYLTACPTNVGTGMRVSVMLHLPGLKMTGEIEKVFRAAHDMRLAIRGLYGEGTEATGDFFQLSNQTTLGRSEKEIVTDFVEELVPKFIDYELKARQSLAEKQTISVDNKIYRAISTLRSARLISSEETLYMLSLVRLGINLGKIKDVDTVTINELFIMTQPAHLQKLHGRTMSGKERAQTRAEMIRKKLGKS